MVTCTDLSKGTTCGSVCRTYLNELLGGFEGGWLQSTRWCISVLHSIPVLMASRHASPLAFLSWVLDLAPPPVPPPCWWPSTSLFVSPFPALPCWSAVNTPIRSWLCFHPPSLALFASLSPNPTRYIMPPQSTLLLGVLVVAGHCHSFWPFLETRAAVRADLDVSERTHTQNTSFSMMWTHCKFNSTVTRQLVRHSPCLDCSCLNRPMELWPKLTCVVAGKAGGCS